jgi:hypothetical protein
VSSSLLIAKFFAPPLWSGLVSRPQLIERGMLLSLRARVAMGVGIVATMGYQVYRQLTRRE